MKKIFLIIHREYITRVRKKSFVIMTLLGPLLMAAMIILPAYLANISEATTKKIVVLDETGWLYKKFKNQEKMVFSYTQDNLENAKSKALLAGNMLLYIPLPQLNIPVNAELYSLKEPGVNVRTYIKTVMKRVVENKKLLASGIDPKLIKAAKVNINLITIKVSENGEEKESNTDVEVGLAIFSGILIYFFIFMFGAQVLKGVMEEKSNRIVEVIISSAKPFQLMMGKIVGVAMVGLTQFLLWVILTGVFIGIFKAGFSSDSLSSGMQILGHNTFSQQAQSVNPANNSMALAQINDILGSINFKTMIFSFLFYFIGGYLLYSSLFAAIGGAVDHDTDTQQFMLPVSIPLIFSVAMSGVIVNQPDSTLSFWLSLFPFTSPVIMMMRIPFGVPIWQIWLSMALLVIGFIFTTWLASKIYRIGILMYGKKVNYVELWKWLKY